uniref:Immunoglobulin V-set domain-containing protein n=1 Tax=Sphaeramia orbicularis TaxID=375764 RepID=A0A673B569_9TELE
SCTTLISVETMTVTSVEGQSFDFICKYPAEMWSNAKYFCVEDGQMCSTVLIKTDKHNNWTRDGRFSLYDNITGAFFLVRVDKLMLQDSRKYWCGVDVNSHPDHISIIQLNVSQGLSLHLITVSVSQFLYYEILVFVST